MIFGLFKKTQEPQKPVWPWPAGSLSEDVARKQLQMVIQRLGPNAQPNKPEIPGMLENQIKNIEQSAAMKRLWSEEVHKSINARADRSAAKKGAENPWAK